MLVRLARDLRQVRNAQHLPALAQAFQQAPDDFRHAAADARVDLVEDQGRHRRRVRRDDGDRQRDTRQFAARRHLGQRPRRDAGVAGHEEFDLLAAVHGRLARVQRDDEAAAAHRQFLHRFRHLRRQALRRLRARRGQLLRGRHVDRLRLLFLLAQAVHVAGVGQLLQLGLQRRVLFRQFFRRHAEFAGRAVDGVHARVDLGQAVRIELDLVDVRVQRIHGFLQLDARRLHAVEHGLQVRVDTGQLRQLQVQRRQLRQDRLLRFRQRIQRFLRAFDQARGMRQAAVFIRDLGPLARLHREFIQLADLPLETLAFQQHVLRVRLEFLALARQRLPRFIRMRDFLHLRARARIAHGNLVVEQRALGVEFQQRLVRVLAVDVDEQFAQFAQLAGRRRDAVDVGLGAAGVVDHAAQQRAAFVGLELVLFQPDARGLGQREVGADVGLGRAFAHHACLTAAAKRELERVDQDRLAGAGLAGEHREAVRELELDRVDDDEVADGK